MLSQVPLRGSSVSENVSENVFIHILCPYLQPTDLYKFSLVGWRPQVNEFLRGKGIPLGGIEAWVCPLCSRWISDQTSCTTPLGGPTAGVDISPYIFPSGYNIEHRNILCASCRVESHGTPFFPFKGHRDFDIDYQEEIIYYHKYGVIYWDKIRFNKWEWERNSLWSMDGESETENDSTC